QFRGELAAGELQILDLFVALGPVFVFEFTRDPVIADEDDLFQFPLIKERLEIAVANRFAIAEGEQENARHGNEDEHQQEKPALKNRAGFSAVGRGRSRIRSRGHSKLPKALLVSWMGLNGHTKTLYCQREGQAGEPLCRWRAWLSASRLACFEKCL